MKRNRDHASIKADGNRSNKCPNGSVARSCHQTITSASTATSGVSCYTLHASANTVAVSSKDLANSSGIN